MDMTPAEIVKKREEIARVLCARKIRFLRHPFEKILAITEDDLKNVPAWMLKKMIRDITPPVITS